MKHPLFLIVAVFVSALSAQARLGFTLEECIAKYGPSIHDDQDYGMNNYIFQKDGYIIMCGLFRDTVQVITYKHEDGSDFSENEIDALLDKNSLGGTWGPHQYNYEAGTKTEFWFSSKHGSWCARGQYLINGSHKGLLTIETPLAHEILTQSVNPKDL